MGNKRPTFSIIIPTYNYAHYLETAIASVFKQSLKDYELIVINDGATDDTDSVIKSIKQKYNSHFQYIKQENSGLSASRNKGINLSSGEYLLFLDSDDWLLPNALEQFFHAIKKHKGCDYIIARYNSVSESGERKERGVWSLSESKEQRFRDYLFNARINFACCSVVFKKTFFDNYQFPSGLRQSEDEAVYAHLMANYEGFKINNIVSEVRKHQISLRNQVHPNLVEPIVEEVFDISRISKQLQKYKTSYRALKHLEQFRTLYLCKEYEKSMNEYIKAFKIDKKISIRLNFLRKFIKCLIKKNL